MRDLLDAWYFTQWNEKNVMADHLRADLQVASDGSHTQSWSISAWLPESLEWIPGGAVPAPSGVVRSTEGITLTWSESSAVTSTVEMAGIARSEGDAVVRAVSVVTSMDGTVQMEMAAPLTITISGSVCPVPSATPTVVVPTATPTVASTPDLRPLFLPLTLNERCVPEIGHADTVLVMDASTSMLEEARPGYTKREAAIDASARFIDLLRPGDQAAVVSFNDSATLEQELTGDKVALIGALAGIANRQFTRLDLGIKAAREELGSARHDPDNRPVLILLTDGKSNPEPVETALAEAALAKDAGITLFVVGLGQVEVLDDAALGQCASRPEYYFRTADASTLTKIYEDIAGMIPCPPERYWGRRR